MQLRPVSVLTTAHACGALDRGIAIGKVHALQYLAQKQGDVGGYTKTFLTLRKGLQCSINVYAAAELTLAGDPAGTPHLLERRPCQSTPG